MPYDVTYDVACLALWEGLELRLVELAMSQHHLLLQPLDPRPCLMVCTPWSLSGHPYPLSDTGCCDQCEWKQPCSRLVLGKVGI
jgi:hypothetical protein